MSLADRLAARTRLRALDRKQVAQPAARLAGRVTAKLEDARRRNPNPDVQEIQRIIDLPIMETELSKEEVDSISRANVLAPAYAKGFRLLEPQARAIKAYDMTGGGFFPVGVGWGKTGIGLMIAERMYRKGFDKTILCIPPSVSSQLVKNDIGFWRRHVPISVPFHNLSGKTKSQRMKQAQSNFKGCYLFPYTLLSTEDSIELLKLIMPKGCIFDEGHNLKNFSAARTRRMMSYITECEPEVVVESGTITDKGVQDYHHLISHALGEGSPLPLSNMQAMGWGVVLDSGAMPSETQTGSLVPLIEWAREHYPKEDLPPIVSGFRRAYRLRLTSTPGVVATGDNEIGVSLTISNREIPKPDNFVGYEELQGFMSLVEDEWITPSGDEIQDRIHIHKWMSELSCGFYNELYWPEPPIFAKRKKISLDEAWDLIEKARLHHTKEQVYNKELREFLLYKTTPEGIDTPMAVGKAILDGRTRGLPSDLIAKWHDKNNLVYEGMPERDRNAVRVCSFKVDTAVAWAREVWAEEKTGGIIWYHHNEVGNWLVERLKAAGLPVLYCPAGENDEIRDEANKGRFMVASIMAHREGKNLQFMQHQFVVQWPRTATVAQQMLGRCHRTGQLADELTVWRADHGSFDVLNFSACLNDAVYHQQTLGTRMKMVFCNYDPLPRVFSPEFLREQGLEPSQLNAEQRAMLADKFGDFSATY